MRGEGSGGTRRGSRLSAIGFRMIRPAQPSDLDVVRALLARRVHRFISKDNDRFMKSAIEKGVRATRARRSA